MQLDALNRVLAGGRWFSFNAGLEAVRAIPEVMDGLPHMTGEPPVILVTCREVIKPLLRSPGIEADPLVGALYRLVEQGLMLSRGAAVVPLLEAWRQMRMKVLALPPQGRAMEAAFQSSRLGAVVAVLPDVPALAKVICLEQSALMHTDQELEEDGETGARRRSLAIARLAAALRAPDDRTAEQLRWPRMDERSVGVLAVGLGALRAGGFRTEVDQRWQKLQASLSEALWVDLGAVGLVLSLKVPQLLQLDVTGILGAGVPLGFGYGVVHGGTDGLVTRVVGPPVEGALRAMVRGRKDDISVEEETVSLLGPLLLSLGARAVAGESRAWDLGALRITADVVSAGVYTLRARKSTATEGMAAPVLDDDFESMLSDAFGAAPSPAPSRIDPKRTAVYFGPGGPTAPTSPPESNRSAPVPAAGNPRDRAPSGTVESASKKAPPPPATAAEQSKRTVEKAPAAETVSGRKKPPPPAIVPEENTWTPGKPPPPAIVAEEKARSAGKPPPPAIVPDVSPRGNNPGVNAPVLAAPVQGSSSALATMPDRAGPPSLIPPPLMLPESDDIEALLGQASPEEDPWPEDNAEPPFDIEVDDEWDDDPTEDRPAPSPETAPSRWSLPEPAADRPSSFSFPEEHRSMRSYSGEEADFSMPDDSDEPAGFLSGPDEPVGYLSGPSELDGYLPGRQRTDGYLPGIDADDEDAAFAVVEEDQTPFNFSDEGLHEEPTSKPRAARPPAPPPPDFRYLLAGYCWYVDGSTTVFGRIYGRRLLDYHRFASSQPEEAHLLFLQQKIREGFLPQPDLVGDPPLGLRSQPLDEALLKAAWVKVA